MPSKRSRSNSKPPTTPLHYGVHRIEGTRTLREWATRNDVRRFIGKRFKEFLLTFVNPKSENEDSEYLRQINEMVSVNKCSLEIVYTQLMVTHTCIAIYLASAPQLVLEVMEDVANKLVFYLSPNYKKTHKKIYVRITNLPMYDKIRGIRQRQLNTMIRIGGVVTRRTRVLPQLQQVK